MKVAPETRLEQLALSMARVGALPPELVNAAQEMRCIYPPEVIFAHMVGMAAKADSTVHEKQAPALALTLEDVDACFSSGSPLLLGCNLPPLPSSAMAELANLFAGRARFSLRDKALRLECEHECVSALGECGDPACGCSRLHRPEVRHAFCELVAAEAPTRGRGYASIGSGGLLADAEILCRLLGLSSDDRLQGAEAPRRRELLKVVVVVDLKYAADASAPAALQRLLGTETRLLAFDSLDAYREAANSNPDLRVATYVARWHLVPGRSARVSYVGGRDLPDRCTAMPTASIVTRRGRRRTRRSSLAAWRSNSMRTPRSSSGAVHSPRQRGPRNLVGIGCRSNRRWRELDAVLGRVAREAVPQVRRLARCRALGRSGWHDHEGR